MNKGFLHFLPNFCHPIFDEIWKIIKYGNNLAKNEEQPCSTSLKNSYCGWFKVSKNWISGTHSATQVHFFRIRLKYVSATSFFLGLVYYHFSRLRYRNKMNLLTFFANLLINITKQIQCLYFVLLYLKTTYLIILVLAITQAKKK